mgnify:CR=1 FL=1
MKEAPEARVLEDAYGDRVPRELAVWIRRMVNDDPLKRPSADQVLRGCPLFRQPLVMQPQRSPRVRHAVVRPSLNVLPKEEPKQVLPTSGKSAPK